MKLPFPAGARRAGVSGNVRLFVHVDLKGFVVAAQVLDGPGTPLNEAAWEAIQQCRFKPARQDGRPVASSFIYNYTFQLD